jgi:hypothetical protein
VRDLGGPACAAPLRPDSSRSRGRCAAPSRRSGRLPEPHRGHGIPRRPTPGLGAPTRGARASRAGRGAVVVAAGAASGVPRALPFAAPALRLVPPGAGRRSSGRALLVCLQPFGARRTHRLETLARIFPRDS